MQLRDRTLKLHASRPTVMEAFASNIPTRRSFAKALDFWPYTTSFSCHDKCQWARRNPFFLSRQLQRAAVRPRPRVSGFTWDIPVLWQEIIAFEYVQASTRHISSCALRNVSPHFARRTQHTFPRLPSRDRADHRRRRRHRRWSIKNMACLYLLTPPQGKTDGSFRNSSICSFQQKLVLNKFVQEKLSDGLFFV